jgi:AcrR family transcriptional regulator
MPDRAAPTSGLRERKKARLRVAIRREALRLFAANGFEATTVEAIAAACDVSPATVYRYYPSKEDIVFAGAERDAEHLAELVAAQPAELAAPEALYRALHGLADDYLRNRPGMEESAMLVDRSISLRARKAESQQRWEQVVLRELERRRTAAGEAPDATVLRFVTATALASFRVATELWLADDAGNLHALLDVAIDRLNTGFGTEPP